MPGNERGLSVAVERLECETAGVDLAAFRHEFHERVVEVLLAGERFVAELRKTAHDPERHAGTVEQDAGLEAFAQKAGCLEKVDKTDRAFEGNRMKGDEGLFTGFGLYVFEDLLFVVDEIITFFMRGECLPRA